MRCVFRFGTALTRTVRNKKLSDVSASDKNIKKVVDLVFRESMLDPTTMNFLSDDMQNQFLRDSIQATIKLE